MQENAELELRPLELHELEIVSSGVGDLVCSAAMEATDPVAPFNMRVSFAG